MSRVSIAASSKPKPKETFKFLRRDEGRLSYSTPVAESPSKGGEGTPRVNRDRRGSRSLREAIAYDMKNAKSHDPFGEVVVAVPKKAPPPNTEAAAAPAAETGRATPASRRAPLRAQSKARPEWVDSQVPVRREVLDRPTASRQEPRQPSAEGYSRAYQKEAEGSAPAGSTGDYEPYTARSGTAAPSNGRRIPVPGASETSFDRFEPSAGSRRANSTSLRYTDPELDGYDRNYFRRAPPPAGCDYEMPPVGRSRAEEDLMLQLEQEVRAAQEERARYTYAKQQLDREKQRFDSFRFATQQQLEDERAELDSQRMKEQRAVQKDVKSIEERYRSVSGLLSTEREANRKLSQENDALRAQLEELTAAMREQQMAHKAEVHRLRRDIDSLTMRNSDLLAMAKEQQIQRLEGAAPAGNSSLMSTNRSVPRSSSNRPALNSDSNHNTADEVGDDGRPTAASSTVRQPPVVMDFTTRSGDDSARERRAREVEERMHREEVEMQRKRQERELEARRAREQQQREEAEAEVERARREAEEAAEREREAARKRRAAAEEKANKKRVEEERRQAQEAAAAAAAATTTTTATVQALSLEEVAKERKVAGHPARTPRMQTGDSSAKKKPAAAVTTAAAAGAPVSVVQRLPSSQTSRKRFAIPSREELVGDSEAMPPESYANDAVASQTALGDNPNKREVLYQSGKREIHYANGTRKVVLPSGHTILHFTNGDIKCTYPSGKSTYWYDAAQTTHTQNPDGGQVFEFNATGQTERHLPDGTKEILYPDGIFKIVKADGTDETFFPEDA